MNGRQGRHRIATRLVCAGKRAWASAALGCGCWRKNVVGSAADAWFDPVDRTLLAREGHRLNHEKLFRLHAATNLHKNRQYYCSMAG
jgi:hypothetical protein